MKIHKEFFRYVIPSMLAFALSGIYAIADGFFVGNALGDNALAAINMAYPLTAFLQAVGTGIGMGGAVSYHQHREQKRKTWQSIFWDVPHPACFGGHSFDRAILIGRPGCPSPFRRYRRN